MIVLGIDTSTSLRSVALLERTQVIASCCVRLVSTRSVSLLRMIDMVCRQSGCQLSEVEGVAVALGPGSFTSLRVGLATGQGVAMAQGIPLVGCSTFEALAMYARGWCGMICPVLDARKGEVYAALYRHQGSCLVEIMAGKVMTPASLCALVKEPTMFLGSGVQAYGAMWSTELGEQAVCVESSVETGLADQVARLGYAHLKNATFSAQPRLQPLYIRPADARLPQYPSLAPVSMLQDTRPQETREQRS